MPIIIPGFENLYLSLYLMAEIATHPHTKWQKSRPMPIPELKTCYPSERHLVPGISWKRTPQGRPPYLIRTEANIAKISENWK